MHFVNTISRGTVNIYGNFTNIFSAVKGTNLQFAYFHYGK